MSPQLRSTLVIAGLAIAAGCKSGDSSGPRHIAVAPATSLSFATRGRTVRLHPAVLTTSGDTVRNQTFSYLSSSVSVATVTDSGVVTSQGNGTATITITSGSLTTQVTVTVSQLPATATKTSGDLQIGNTGTAAPQSLVLVVADSAGFPAAGVTVTYSIASGGGSVTPSAVTNTSGLATVSWTLGPSAPVQSVTATVPSVGTATFTGYAIQASAAGFQINVVNVGPALDPQVQAAFDAAASFWQSAITGDIANVTAFADPAAQCGPGSAMGPVNIDDVVILVRVENIDGAGGTLGSAFPCFVRIVGGTTIGLAFTGVMRFDASDIPSLIASGGLNSVVRHEMGHVLGFGSLWPASLGSFTSFGCLQNASTTASHVDTYYSCARGAAVFDSIGGTSYTGGNKVPLENCVAGVPASCGSGNLNGHWREVTFGNELMTGFTSGGGSDPLSVLSLAAMQDLGYTVNLGVADPYSHTFSVPSAFEFNTVGISLGDDYHGPIFGWTSGRRAIRIGTVPR